MSHYLQSNQGRSLSISESERENIVNDAKIIEDFLRSSRSQITMYGLRMLHEDIKDNLLAILYHNDRYETICKYQGQLFCLGTDKEIFEHESDVIWTRLSIDGQCKYFKGDFTECNLTNHIEPEMPKIESRFLLTQVEAMKMKSEQLAEIKENLEKSLLLLRDLENRSEQAYCIVCFENKKTVVFIPCKHCSCCKACSTQVANCPICRHAIIDRMEIFM
jgi:hypothetical protein